MVEIIMIFALVMYGINFFLWFSWVRETGGSYMTDPGIDPTPAGNSPVRGGFGLKREKSKMQKIKSAISNDSMEFGDRDDMGMLGLQERGRDGNISDILNDIDLEFGDSFDGMRDEPIVKEEKTSEKMSLEDEFSELFQEEEEKEETSSNNPVSTQSESSLDDELSFLENYDFDGDFNENIKGDGTKSVVDEDDKEIKIPLIDGVNFGTEEKELEASSDGDDDKDDILYRLERLQNTVERDE